ncbi:MAG: class I SAM-dependent methyltransferase [Patescibacteria group bacterium]
MAHYSQIHQNILEKGGRTRVGKQLLAIARDYFGDKLTATKVLDVGCAGGTITALFAQSAESVLGIDPDKPAIEQARRSYRARNLRFEVADALKLPWGGERFDLVVCNQVYEFVPDDTKLMSEIYRVLKPGGVCLFGGRNRWTLMEAQYQIPLLSWFPPRVSQLILSLIRPGTTYVGRYRGYFSLKLLCRKFEIIDYTPKVLADPEKYGFTKLAKTKWATKIGARLYPLAAPLVPNFLWFLRKR